MVDRLLSSLVAVCLAFLVWLYARSRDQETLDNVQVPVQIALSPNQIEHFELEVTGPSQVSASFTGPPSRIRELRSLLRRGEIRVELTFTVPEGRLNESHYLDTIHIEAADIQAPPGVTPVVAEGRNRIPVTVYRLVDRRLPVRFDYGAEERISQAVLEPTTVCVHGPQDILDRARSISTQPFTLPSPIDLTSTEEQVWAGTLPLIRDMEGRPIRTNPDGVAVRLSFRPRQKVYELSDVPVQFLCPGNFPSRPRFRDDHAGKINVRVVGPAGEDPPVVIAFIDLSGHKSEAGLYSDEPLRLQLPKDFQLLTQPPRSAPFELVPIE